MTQTRQFKLISQSQLIQLVNNFVTDYPTSDQDDAKAGERVHLHIKKCIVELLSMYEKNERKSAESLAPANPFQPTVGFKYAAQLKRISGIIADNKAVQFQPLPVGKDNKTTLDVLVGGKKAYTDL